MNLTIMLVVGLITALLSSVLAKGTGYGILADIVFGIAGAFVGGITARALGLQLPFTGLAATAVVGFVGATLLLAALGVMRRRSQRAG